jgi:hypothetical protein
MIEQQKQASSFLFRPTWDPQEREYDFRALVHCQKAKAAANLAHADARHFSENTNQNGKSAEIYPPTKQRKVLLLVYWGPLANGRLSERICGGLWRSNNQNNQQRDHGRAYDCRK